ncbi:hypothetical protein D1646_05000 [Pseudoflavonifractor sp. 60]|uniref:hypothetical protein n=1 Tax=Pseudoflavonifractor sp. 60 TaxID=2304576 RepID=UPI00137057C5|nr:hypothetical protein [Pseudoflavonifractor sp. 60]NBI66179.1 hypothetical protein [Pseudoflavonifractor sp. 60]
MILYRPVGEQELALIEASGFTRFPPRLPEQPIFYPVLNEQYATEIAEKWNTRDPSSGFRGYVTRFQVDDHFLKKYPIHTVGRSYHQELWIPAEGLDQFNSHIIGAIEIIKTLNPSDNI